MERETMRSIFPALAATMFFLAAGCADRSVDPWSDSGPTPMNDAGTSPVDDAGEMPTPDAGPTPAPDAGTPPAEDSGPEPTPDAGPPPPVDNDGDGSPVDVDCDDMDPSVHPGATEVCDAVDNDCDGLVNEGVCATFPDCGGREHARYVTVRVMDDAVAELPENIGACAATWDPYMLCPSGEPCYNWGYVGNDLHHEYVFSFEQGWMRFGFRCGSGEWATALPEGRVASDAGLLIEVFFADGTAEDISDTTTFVRGSDGVRLHVSMHRGCTLWGS